MGQYVEPIFAMRLIEDHPEHSGYLPKERIFDVAILIDALRRIDDGDTVIDPAIISRLVGNRRRHGPLADLTREQEVLSMIADGLSNRAIAQRIYLSERTVEAHVTQIFRKLGPHHDRDVRTPPAARATTSCNC